MLETSFDDLFVEFLPRSKYYELIHSFHENPLGFRRELYCNPLSFCVLANDFATSIRVYLSLFSRGSSIGPLEPQASRSQHSQQLRSQQSQQSFSQGPSSYSQRGCFSQRTQGSVDELVISDQV